MKRLFFMLLISMLSPVVTFAQSEKLPFRAYIINKEYDVYLNIDFYDETIQVPGQELYGTLPGYLGKSHNSFCWVITSAKMKGQTAQLQLINDYGSEDLTATLTYENDSTYTLKQTNGSTIKVPKSGKWQKLPKTLIFTPR